MGRLLLRGAPLSHTLKCPSRPPSLSLVNPVSRQFGFIFHFIIVIKIIIASQVCDEVTGNLNQTFVLGDTLCESNDRGATIVLAIVWVLFHVILFLDAKIPRIYTNRVRRSQFPA